MGVEWLSQWRNKCKTVALVYGSNADRQHRYDAKHVVDEERGSESEASVPLAPATVTSAPSDHSHSVQTVQTHTVVTEEATVRVVADE